MISEQLLAALNAADESYLIGLSNKGTVNRAKKDLAKESPVVEPEGDALRVTIGGEICTITAPLGKSTCTCPSTAICRHRIGAILFLQARTAREQPEETKSQFAELRVYPSEKLARQLGPKRVASILLRHAAGDLPVMEAGSVIFLEVGGFRVRLLEPLEHSTCSCHSRSFCNHRAEALLLWQLREGIAKPEALAAPDRGPDPEHLRTVCAAVRRMLEDQMVTGIARMSESVCDTVERMAALCHTAGHAELERALRRLHGEYAACVARSAAFRPETLLRCISGAYRLAAATEEAENPAPLLGTFREAYEPVGRLPLYLLGWRERHGSYSGTTYYFYHRETGEFLTYSDLRPTFYDNRRRRNEVSPWDLPCTLRQAFGCALDLSGARKSASGNLSATQECKAALLGPRDPWTVVGQVETDFEVLLERSSPHLPEVRRLALLRPGTWETPEFDRVKQLFSLRLWDARGRDLFLEVRYRKEEAELVEHLERRLGEGTREGVFFVSLYREGDKLKCYPIEYFADWREDRGGTP